jgi:anti-sigma B factor antagonist
MAEPGDGRGGRELWKLNVTRERFADVCVLAAHGRVGSDAASDFAILCVRALQERESRLLIDLNGVDYMSSPGLAALEEIATLTSKAGGALVLCHLSEPVRLALDLAGLTGAFIIEPNRDAGLARLSAMG